MSRFVLFVVISVSLMLGYTIHERGGKLVIDPTSSSHEGGLEPFAWNLFDRLESRPGDHDDSSAFRAPKVCACRPMRREPGLRGIDVRATL